MIILMVAAALQAGSLPVQTTVKSGARPAPARTAPAPRAPRVVLDAGHGGRDPGGPMRLPRGIHEKDVALGVALKLGQELHERGVEVIYTRKTDTLIARADRGRIANESGGDLFISIHVNAANPRWSQPAAARGFETYFLGVAKTEDAQRVEEMEEAAVRFETNAEIGEKDPLSFILSDMMQNEHLRESADLAAIIQRHLGKTHPGPDRGVKQAGFTVLVTAFMPAVLVEVGFGTNPAEAEYLASAARQRSLARSIADATMEYLERYHRRVGSGSAFNAHE